MVNYFNNKIKLSSSRILRLEKQIKSITCKSVFKQFDLTRYKKLEASLTAQAVTVLDLNTGIIVEYPSARSAALALKASNSTVMNKLNGRNSTPLFR